jgi:alkylated DNA repair dioxygenase AlkB
METLSLFAEYADEMGLEADPELNALTARLARGVPGLLYVPEFVTRAEEAALISDIDSYPWSTHWQRRTQHYGRDYDRGTGGAAIAPPSRLPCWAGPVIDRLVALGVFARPPDQIGVNEYLSGQGIAPHVDHFNGAIVSLSLLSGCVMDLIQIDGPGRVSLWLAPRGILVMRGAARRTWMHGIARRRKDVFHGRTLCRGRRVSILVRDLRPESE